MSKEDKDFRDILIDEIERLGLTDKDIAHEFGVSRPTVIRWKNGTNTPHPLAQKTIIDWLKKR